MTLSAELVAAVHQHAPPDGVAWLDAQLASLSPTTFPPAFAAAGRKLGHGAVDGAAISIPWPATGADECGRAALVLAAIATSDAADHVPFIRDLIRRGDARERQAVLRVLAGLPDPARFVDLAIDACRTNVQSVFEAIACDNAYPSRHFPELAFNQMTIKALFIGAPLARITGLSARLNDDLTRMVEAYASERRAAGRPVPEDAQLIRKRP